MYDFHIHSEYSMDSKASMISVVESAIDKNLKSICFTDHIDLESTVNKIDFSFRDSDYFKNIKQVKYRFMRDIEILAGVEIGMQPHLSKRYDDFLDNKDFDFILMSIHSVDGKDISMDRYVEGKDSVHSLINYYTEMYESVLNFDNFDILGHVDYIDRYFPDYSNIPRFDQYSKYVENVLKLIIEKDKGIEVNTAGMRYGLGYFHPKIQILKMYKELGGEIITIGSDAHRAEDVGYGYREAEKMLKELGFKYIYIFKGRKKYPINIG